MTALRTDYLVVGAGLSGLGFVDALVAHCDADVVLVDRRDRPGGHWLDAYPFVRLHLPSACYGVASRPLERGTGPDADGLAERATGDDVRRYLVDVLAGLLATGRVRFLGLHDHVQRPDGTSVLVSRVTGEQVGVDVHRAVVDAAYHEGETPATHRRSFSVDDGATCVPVGDLVRLGAPGERYTVLGSGKTAMDACTWLLDQGVAPERLRWVRPRDAWLLDRRSLQPHEQVGSVLEGFSLDVEAVAAATSSEDLFARLESTGRLLRLDSAVEPTMYHCAIVGPTELAQLRSVEDVVRRGRVRHVGSGRLVLDDGEVPTSAGEVVLDCTARGLSHRPVRPVFEPGRVTVQQVRPCQPSLNAAVTGYVAATRDDLAQANALTPPSPVPSVPADWVTVLGGGLAAMAAWRAVPDVQAWVDRCRLDPAHGAGAHLDDPRVATSTARFGAHVGAAVQRLRTGFAPAQRTEGDAVVPAG